MSTELLVAFLSVSIGWILGQLGNFLSQRSENKKTYGKTIFRLLRIWSLSKSYDHLIERYKNIAEDLGPEDSEYIRQYFLKSQRENNFVDEDSINELINDISEFDPILGYKIKGQLYSFVAIYTKEFENYNDNPALYNSLVTLVREINKAGIPILEKVIKRIALRMNLWQWVKVKYYLKNESERVASIKRSFKEFEKDFA
ncbi:MAG: hypothetical protein WEA56_08360 [Balneolaceae bacterium]